MDSIKVLSIKTSARAQLVDITGQLSQLVAETGIKEGICYLYVPHTTAALVINENADPTVVQDILDRLDIMAPWKNNYRHQEGNAAAHIKASLLKTSEAIFIVGGRLLLGTWQGIFFCEFDGPRERKVFIKLMTG